MTDPLVSKMTNTCSTYVYAGQIDKMTDLCEGNTYDGMLTKFGNDVVIDALRVQPLSLKYGLQTRTMLFKKVMSLGVDLSPAFLVLSGADDLDEAGRAKALKPAAMLKTILASPPIDLRLHASRYSLDDFLVLIPLEVIKKSRKNEEALRRRFEITHEPDLLKYGTNKTKGKFVEEALGL
jgi:hypothetical protein